MATAARERPSPCGTLAGWAISRSSPWIATRTCSEIEAGVIYGSVVQKSYMEMYLAVHLLYWLHNDLLKVLPDWRAAGVNILPDQGSDRRDDGHAGNP